MWVGSCFSVIGCGSWDGLVLGCSAEGCLELVGHFWMMGNVSFAFLSI